MISHKYIDSYVSKWERGDIIFNEERILLVSYLRERILCQEDYYFDDRLIEDYVRFSEKFYFPLDDWEKFIVPFVFLFSRCTGELVFEQFFITMGRGGGKNGFISTLCHFLISKLHGVRNYDVTIVANSEEQAQRSFMECHNKIDEKPSLARFFDNGKAKIVDKSTKSVFKFATSNAKTKDGGREGCVIYDEIHEMVDDAIVNVFSGGLGKVDYPREFFISTNGFVRDGYYDKLYEKCLSVLKGESDELIFPFICKLDDASEVANFDLWEKANPAFSKPMSKRAVRLFNKRRNQYDGLVENPSGRKSFMTKQMNLPEADLEKDVTSREKLLATQRDGQLDLTGRSCVVGFDYASMRDFASVGMLFVIDSEFVWRQHTFVRKEFLDVFRPKAPISDWASEGLVTIVDGPSIDPRLVVAKMVKWRERYQIELVCGDNFRMDLIKPMLEEEGFAYEFLRNPSGVQAKVAPIIEDGFANERFNFGRDRMMLWFTDNTYVKEDGNGNKRFLKKEPVRRKTDGFHALIAALYKREVIQETNVTEFLSAMTDWEF